jgi:hypothetical protein
MPCIATPTRKSTRDARVRRNRGVPARQSDTLDRAWTRLCGVRASALIRLRAPLRACSPAFGSRLRYLFYFALNRVVMRGCLGARLIKRTGRMCLTEAAREYHRRCSAVISELAEADSIAPEEVTSTSSSRLKDAYELFLRIDPKEHRAFCISRRWQLRICQRCRFNRQSGRGLPAAHSIGMPALCG